MMTASLPVYTGNSGEDLAAWIHQFESIVNSGSINIVSEQHKLYLAIQHLPESMKSLLFAHDVRNWAEAKKVLFEEFYKQEATGSDASVAELMSVLTEIRGLVGVAVKNTIDVKMPEPCYTLGGEKEYPEKSNIHCELRALPMGFFQINPGRRFCSFQFKHPRILKYFRNLFPHRVIIPGAE